MKEAVITIMDFEDGVPYTKVYRVEFEGDIYLLDDAEDAVFTFCRVTNVEKLSAS